MRFLVLVIVLLGVLAAASTPETPRGANAGARLVQSYGCGGCHGAQLQGGSDGPRLVGIEQRLDPRAIAAFIKYPREPMPNFRFSEAQIASIVAYLVSLDGGIDGAAPTASFEPATPTGRTQLSVRFPRAVPRAARAVAVLQPEATSVRTDTVALAPDGDDHLWRCELRFPRPGRWIVEISYDGERFDVPISVATL